MSTVVATTATGDAITLDASHEATAPFGFHAGDHVRFTKSRDNGKVARVVGVCDGMLWFRTLPSDVTTLSPEEEEAALPVRTTSARCSAEYIRQYGWVALDTH
jgi:hypothetical protein